MFIYLLEVGGGGLAGGASGVISQSLKRQKVVYCSGARAWVEELRKCVRCCVFLIDSVDGVCRWAVL